MMNSLIPHERTHTQDGSRLQAPDFWSVPVWNLGGHDLPRLFLGDHGFLSKYGSRMRISEIAERMHYALSLASLGLAAGDERCLKATRHATRISDQRPCVLYHTDLALRSGAKRIHFGRCMASLLQMVRDWAPKFTECDPIVGSFLRYFAAYQPYGRDEIGKLEMAESAWEKEMERIRCFHPAVVTVGGDYLDFVLAVERFDIAQSALMLYHQLGQQLSIPLVMTSYTGYFTMDRKQKNFLSDLFDAIMVPINPMGFGMLPDSTNLLSWAHQFRKPIIAMHPIGSGQVNVGQGLAYSLEVAGAAAAIVGASTHEHIGEFVRAGRATLPGDVK